MLGNIIENAINFEEILTEGMIAFLDNLPAFVERMTEAVIERFSDPTFTAKLAVSFTKAFIQAIANIPGALARGISKGVSQAIPNIAKAFNVGKIVLDSLLDAFKQVPNFLSKLFRFDSGGKGPVESFLNFDFPFVKFASGGLVGGKSSSRDSEAFDKVPALLSKGEVVLPKSVVNGTAEGVVGFLQGLGLKLPGFGFGGFISDIFDTFGGFVGGIGRSVGEILGDAFGSDFGDTFSGVFSSVTDVNRFFEAFDPSTFFSEVVKDPAGAVSGLQKRGFKSISDYVTGVVSEVGKVTLPD